MICLYVYLTKPVFWLVMFTFNTNPWTVSHLATLMEGYGNTLWCNMIFSYWKMINLPINEEDGWISKYFLIHGIKARVWFNAALTSGEDLALHTHLTESSPKQSYRLLDLIVLSNFHTYLQRKWYVSYTTYDLYIDFEILMLFVLDKTEAAGARYVLLDSS